MGATARGGPPAGHNAGEKSRAALRQSACLCANLWDALAMPCPQSTWLRWSRGAARSSAPIILSYVFSFASTAPKLSTAMSRVMKSKMRERARRCENVREDTRACKRNTRFVDKKKSSA